MTKAEKKKALVEQKGYYYAGLGIRECREAAHMTQKELGDKCGIDPANIRKYESGKQNPKLETIKRIADGLGVSWDNLCYFVEDSETLKMAREINSKNVQRDKIRPAVVNLLKAIYGKCEYSTVYAEYGEHYFSEDYYSMQLDKYGERQAIEPDDIDLVIDVIAAVTTAVIDRVQQDEDLLKKSSAINLKTRIAEHEAGKYQNEEVLDLIDEEFKHKKFKNKTNIRDLDLRMYDDTQKAKD